MKLHSRRRFLNNICVGSVGLGVLGSISSCVEYGTNTKASSVNLPIIDEVDICILGGSCTGVFAGVRAARLGASVAVVEKTKCIWRSRNKLFGEYLAFIV